jgi:hypothetical protein
LQKRKEANDMKRLTGKDKNGKYYIVEEKYCMCTEKINPIRKWVVDNEIRGYGKPIDRLGKIEDLLDQYNIKDLKELDKLLTMATSYEELSKQLGCPLNVYMQIEMYSVYGLYDEKGDFWKFDYVTYRHFRCYRKNDKDEIIDKTFDVNGYKKTWWLKEDKSE